MYIVQGTGTGTCTGTCIMYKVLGHVSFTVFDQIDSAGYQTVQMGERRYWIIVIHCVFFLRHALFLRPSLPKLMHKVAQRKPNFV